MKRPTLLLPDDRGIAMITVMGAMFVMTLLTVFAVQMSRHSLDTTSTDRARAQGTAIAQGGLDATFHKLNTTTDTTTLPCGTQSGVTLNSGPTTSTYTVTITYYSTFPITSDTALTCSQISAGSVPAAAEIKSVGSTNSFATGPKREMDALVRLTQNPTSPTFDMAVYSNSPMAITNNHPTINGSGAGEDANIYVNGNMNCANQYVSHGNLYVQGAFTGNNKCNVVNDVYAKNGFTASQTGSIGGKVYVSAGAIALNNSFTIGYGYASGNITPWPAPNSNILHQATKNMSNVSPPPTEAFPQLNYSAWGGFTQVTDNTCANVPGDFTGATTPTQIQTTCALGNWKNQTFSLKTDVAIFSTGGFTMDGTKWQSADANPHTLYLIVPYSAATPPCPSGPGITLNNQTSWATSPHIYVFYYTPCTLTFNNQDAGSGQAYAGNVVVSNNFSFTFHQVGGVGGGPGTNPAYVVGIQYEREVAAP